MKKNEMILVLDCGSMYTQQIARKIREMGVFSSILPWDAPIEKIKELEPKGIIVSGHNKRVLESGTPKLSECLFELGLPLLGVGYGAKLFVEKLGGEIEQGACEEYHRTLVRVERPHALFDNIPGHISVYMDDQEHIASIPHGCNATAHDENKNPVAFQCSDIPVAGVLFHPEVSQTENGFRVLKNFVMGICNCAGDWKLGEWISKEVASIREKVGSGRVVAGLSGGVDSTVAAVLTSRAVGQQLECIFVDHGLLRKDEAKQVLDTYKQLELNVHFVDASQQFLEALKGVTDPERKRKIIGELFVRVFEAKAAELGGADWLLQGTIYPDVIESGTSANETIKSHHNVGGLPEDIKFKLLEPLVDLFKSEVREIGALMGVPDHFLSRHPFPGPGLGVRCLGELTKERLDTLREADAIFIEEIRKAGLYKEIWQAFCVLIPTRSVGVVGVNRTYGETIAIRAVNSQDAMTAEWVRLPWEVVDIVSRRIGQEVSGVTRVVLDVSNKPPATIEWE